MDTPRSPWLPLAFTVCFAGVGLTYWPIPYNKINLPDALLTPALILLVLAALLLLAFHAAPFWKSVRIVAAALPASVFARVVVEGLRDPSSHNLWPLEIVIALLLGFACALAGALAGLLIDKSRIRPPGAS